MCDASFCFFLYCVFLNLSLSPFLPLSSAVTLGLRWSCTQTFHGGSYKHLQRHKLMRDTHWKTHTQTERKKEILTVWLSLLPNLSSCFLLFFSHSFDISCALSVLLQDFAIVMLLPLRCKTWSLLNIKVLVCISYQFCKVFYPLSIHSLHLIYFWKIMPTLSLSFCLPPLLHPPNILLIASAPPRGSH